jgi:hypothetical protein
VAVPSDTQVDDKPKGKSKKGVLIGVGLVAALGIGYFLIKKKSSGSAVPPGNTSTVVNNPENLQVSGGTNVNQYEGSAYLQALAGEGHISGQLSELNKLWEEYNKTHPGGKHKPIKHIPKLTSKGDAGAPI